MSTLEQALSYYEEAEQLLLKGQYAEGIVCFEQAEVIFADLEEWKMLTMCLNMQSEYLKLLNKHHEAIQKAERALGLGLYVFGEFNVIVADSYSQIGVSCIKLGDIQKAIDSHRKAIHIKQSILGNKHEQLAGYYSNLGLCYRILGDYVLSITCYNKAIAIFIETYGERDISIAKCFINLGVCYRENGDYTQAIEIYEKAKSIFQELVEEQKINIISCEVNIAVCYYKLGHFAQALEANQKIVYLLYKAYPEGQHILNVVLNNIGVNYSKLNFYQKAEDSFKISLEMKLSYFGNLHPSTGACYRAMADNYLLQHNFPLAFYNLKKSFQSFNLEVNNENDYLIPELKNYNSARELLDSLVLKGKVFLSLFQLHQHFQDLIASIAHLYSADHLVDLIRQSFKTEGSKLTLSENTKSNVYDKGLDIAWMADQHRLKIGHQKYIEQADICKQTYSYNIPTHPIEQAFYFLEKSKSVLLRAAMKEDEARVNANLPTDMLEQEQQLRLDLSLWEHKIAMESVKPENIQDKTTLADYHSQHYDCKQQYDLLIAQLEQDYPKYYRLKYDLKVAQITQIQAALPPKTALLNYGLTDKHLYCFVITPTGCHWTQQVLPPDFEGFTEDYLYSFEPFGKEYNLVYGHEMYKILLQPLEQYGWLDGIARLVIIPDGSLSQIPFEALHTTAHTTNVPYQHHDYLLNRYVISYHYSATLWLNQQTKDKPKPQNERSFLGFAPVYSDNIQPSLEHDLYLNFDKTILQYIGLDTSKTPKRLQYQEAEGIVRGNVEGKQYAELLYSEIEVQKAGQAFAQTGLTARILLHQSATLDNFKALAGQYRYILIAAHADVNDQMPERTGIIFSPNKEDGKGIFYMADAYNLRLQAEVVVLSCCETGLGKVKKGEGTLALNRGFIYSGAKNVVYTLFKVYDKESSELTTAFFQQLLKGLACADALHQAKLQLIQRGLMPIKWAGYVLVGE